MYINIRINALILLHDIDILINCYQKINLVP